MVQIVGKYEAEGSENMDAFLKALGQGDKIAYANTKSQLEIAVNGDEWTLTVSNQGKSVASKFKLGETYDEHMVALGGSVKSVTKKETDSKFVTVSTFGDVTITRIYEVSDSGIVGNLTENKTGVTAKRMYKRL